MVALLLEAAHTRQGHDPYLPKDTQIMAVPGFKSTCNSEIHIQ